MAAGRLGGIARRDRPHGPIETLSRVAVTREDGIQGDYKGAVAPGRSSRRQVSLIEAESWAAAMVELGLVGGEAPPWHARRANLLVEGFRLPREAGR